VNKEERQKQTGGECQKWMWLLCREGEEREREREGERGREREREREREERGRERGAPSIQAIKLCGDDGKRSYSVYRQTRICGEILQGIFRHLSQRKDDNPDELSK